MELTQTKLGDEGMESLAQIRTLNEISLYRTKVIGKGLGYLVKLKGYISPQ